MQFLDPFWARHPDYQQWATDELWQRRVELWKWYGGPGSYGVEGKVPEWLRSQVPSNQYLWFYARDLVWWYSYQAVQIAGRDLPKAQKMAREIPTPECCRQGTEAFIGIAAKTLTDESFREAYRCAWSADEPFRRIAFSCLVMRTEIRVGRNLEMHRVEKLLKESQLMEHTLNRALSVVGVWSTIFPLGREYRAKAQMLAIEAALGARSWKSPVLVQEMIHQLRTDDPQAARALFERMPDSKIKRQVQASLIDLGPTRK